MHTAKPIHNCQLHAYTFIVQTAALCLYRDQGDQSRTTIYVCTELYLQNTNAHDTTMRNELYYRKWILPLTIYLTIAVILPCCAKQHTNGMTHEENGKRFRMRHEYNILSSGDDNETLACNGIAHFSTINICAAATICHRQKTTEEPQALQQRLSSDGAVLCITVVMCLSAIKSAAGAKNLRTSIAEESLYKTVAFELSPGVA